MSGPLIASEYLRIRGTIARDDPYEGDPGSTDVHAGARGDGRIQAAYPHGAYERLAEIKRRYDPSKLFRQNQSIRPSVTAR